MKGNSSFLIIGFEGAEPVRVMSYEITFNCLPINKKRETTNIRDYKSEQKNYQRERGLYYRSQTSFARKAPAGVTLTRTSNTFSTAERIRSSTFPEIS